MLTLREWEVGFGQDRLPNTQRSLENENVGGFVLGILSGDRDRFVTPNMGSLYNHADGMFVKPKMAISGKSDSI